MTRHNLKNFIDESYYDEDDYGGEYGEEDEDYKK